MNKTTGLKIVFTLLLISPIFYLLQQKMVVKQDMVEALEEFDAFATGVFKLGAASKVTSQRIFIKVLTPDETLVQQVRKDVAQWGYRPSTFIEFNEKSFGSMATLTPFILGEKLQRLIEQFDQKKFVTELTNLIYLPGTEQLVVQKIKDPLSLNQALIEQLLGQQKKNVVRDQGQILVFERQGDIDFTLVSALRSYLLAQQDRLVWTGSDFFALENYEVIKRDIALCTTISVLVTITIFYIMTKSLYLLVFLLVGTAVSYLGGLIALYFYSASVFAIVLTFTSTFIGFNNEYLVHFAGLSESEKKQNLIGISSAIGTTFIGFIVLLFSGSAMILQMGLVSIGGGISFLIFLWIFKTELKQVSFHPISIPFVTISKKTLVVLMMVMTGIAIYLSSIVSFQTRLTDFRYSTPILEQNTTTLSLQLAQIPIPKYAVQIEKGDLFENFLKLQVTSFHPLNYYMPPSLQQKVFPELNKKYLTLIQDLNKNLIDSKIPVVLEPEVKWLQFSVEQYLQLWSQAGLGAWTGTYHNHKLLYVTEKPIDEKSIWLLSPMEFYQKILNLLQQRIAIIFLISIALMFIYLMPWQINIWKVFYIFAPLLCAYLIFVIFLWFTHKNFNLIHLLGLSLVIAVAIDYSSILVSSHFSAKNRSKVVLTGMISLATFGALLFAKHPLIWDLGVVVGIGVFISLIFCLMVRMDFEK